MSQRRTVYSAGQRVSITSSLVPPLLLMLVLLMLVTVLCSIVSALCPCYSSHICACAMYACHVGTSVTTLVAHVRISGRVTGWSALCSGGGVVTAAASCPVDQLAGCLPCVLVAPACYVRVLRNTYTCVCYACGQQCHHPVLSIYNVKVAHLRISG